MRALVVIAALTMLPAPADAKDIAPHERITCSIAAALKFRLAPELLLAVAETEGGKPGQWVRNANGSHDVGPMQFNTKYLAHLEKQYGITPSDVAASGCYPYELAAWRLRRHLDRDRGDVWTRVANYHSRASAHNAKYRRKLIAKAASWRSRLQRTYAPTSSRTALKQSRRESVPRRDRAPEPHEPLGLDAYEEDLLARLGSKGVEHHSASRGKPHRGTLEGGTQVPAHRGYTVLDRGRAWGTAQSVQWLVSAFDSLVATDPSAPAVQIHDMSLRNGGEMRGHRSHQNGRDVDITYFRQKCRIACGQRALKPDELDAARQWSLLSYWLTRNQLELAFVDHALQKPLYEAARRAGATSRELARWFQYPRSMRSRVGVIRHVPNHADHLHVRFRCGNACNSSFDSTELERGEREMLELLE